MSPCALLPVSSNFSGGSSRVLVCLSLFSGVSARPLVAVLVGLSARPTRRCRPLLGPNRKGAYVQLTPSGLFRLSGAASPRRFPFWRRCFPCPGAPSRRSFALGCSFVGWLAACAAFRWPRESAFSHRAAAHGSRRRGGRAAGSGPLRVASALGPGWAARSLRPWRPLRARVALRAPCRSPPPLGRSLAPLSGGRDASRPALWGRLGRSVTLRDLRSGGAAPLRRPSSPGPLAPVRGSGPAPLTPPGFSRAGSRAASSARKTRLGPRV